MHVETFRRPKGLLHKFGDRLESVLRDTDSLKAVPQDSQALEDERRPKVGMPPGGDRAVQQGKLGLA